MNYLNFIDIYGDNYTAIKSMIVGFEVNRYNIRIHLVSGKTLVVRYKTTSIESDDNYKDLQDLGDGVNKALLLSWDCPMTLTLTDKLLAEFQ